MSESMLIAHERIENPHAVRKSGYVPGVVYGEGFRNGLAVKFEEPIIKKMLSKHGINAKVNVKIGTKESFGVIKEIQKHPVSGELVHLDLHLISKSEILKLKLPILFSGRHKLEEKKFLLQVQLNEIEVAGKADLLPESVAVDVSNKTPGDSILVKDLPLDKEIKLNHDLDDIVAVITAFKETNVASETTEAADEPEKTEKK